MLAKAAAPHPVEIYRDDMEAGAVLFRASQEGATLAYWLLRVEETAEGKEGVMVAAGGRADFDLYAALMPVVERQFISVRSVRAHAVRPGAARKILRQPGWKVAEVVLRKVM